MESTRNILLTFVVNMFFSIFELIGGIVTRSNAIISDALHDFGDALSVGLIYFLDIKSKKKANNKYTFGYLRYSMIGSFISTLILLVSSFFVIIHSAGKIINPVEINYDGMILFAVVGVVVNLIVAYITRKGHSFIEEVVNLHMLEDVLGWFIILIGSVIMRFTGLSIIDPILSIIVSGFIIYKAFGHLKVVLDLFLEKTPEDISINSIKRKLLKIDGVISVHNFHVWSIDEEHDYATLHVVVDEVDSDIKEEIREELENRGIDHSTIELETEDEGCNDIEKK